MLLLPPPLLLLLLLLLLAATNAAAADSQLPRGCVLLLLRASLPGFRCHGRSCLSYD